MRARGIAVIVFALGAGALFALYLWKSSPRLNVPTNTAPSAEEGGSGSAVSAAARHPIPAASPALQTVSDKDRKLLSDLKQIFASKNDNDPRLDTEFRNLTPGMKQLLRQEYEKLPPESLNERGTIVFLIGRELKTPEDFAFLGQVGDQAPCLSLGDCTKQASISEESMHEEVAVSVTLTYPQRVALKSLENLLSDAQNEGGGDSSRVSMALNTLGTIKESPVGWVAQKAAEIQSRYLDLPH